MKRSSRWSVEPQKSSIVPPPSKEFDLVVIVMSGTHAVGFYPCTRTISSLRPGDRG